MINNKKKLLLMFFSILMVVQSSGFLKIKANDSRMEMAVEIEPETKVTKSNGRLLSRLVLPPVVVASVFGGLFYVFKNHVQSDSVAKLIHRSANAPPDEPGEFDNITSDEPGELHNTPPEEPDELNNTLVKTTDKGIKFINRNFDVGIFKETLFRQMANKSLEEARKFLLGEMIGSKSQEDIINKANSLNSYNYQETKESPEGVAARKKIKECALAIDGLVPKLLELEESLYENQGLDASSYFKFAIICVEISLNFLVISFIFRCYIDHDQLSINSNFTEMFDMVINLAISLNGYIDKKQVFETVFRIGCPEIDKICNLSKATSEDQGSNAYISMRSHWWYRGIFRRVFTTILFFSRVLFTNNTNINFSDAKNVIDELPIMLSIFRKQQPGISWYETKGEHYGAGFSRHWELVKRTFNRIL
jgi:hypothetical protein